MSRRSTRAVDEIKELRKEANANRELRATLNSEGAAERIFKKVRAGALHTIDCLSYPWGDETLMCTWPHRAQVYIDDIARLLKMEDMWAHRKAPHTLDWQALSAAEASTSAAAAAKEGSEENAAAADGKSEQEQARIQDQRKLSLKDSFDLFVDA